MPRRRRSGRPPRRAARANPELEDGGGAIGASAAVDGGSQHCGHRPLFPLRLRGWQTPTGCGGRRYLARRRRLWESSEWLVARSVRALNGLAANRGDGSLAFAEPQAAQPDAPLSAAEHSALNNIGRAVKACLPVPDRTTEYPDGALCELLRCRDLYDSSESLAVMPDDPAKLEVVRGAT